MSALEILAKLAAIDKPRQLKFGLYKNEGWTTSSSADVIRLLCDVWNARAELGALAASVDRSAEGGETLRRQGLDPKDESAVARVSATDAHPQDPQSEQS